MIVNVSILLEITMTMVLGDWVLSLGLRDSGGGLVYIFVLLGKNIGRQTATRVHEQKA